MSNVRPQMSFSPTFVLLQQEAFLARGSLAVGLTALRNATVSDKSEFYSGFFNTSIAIERVMKLIVVTDHMLRHGYRAPSKGDLKAYGHDLLTLYSSCVAAADRGGIEGFALPPPQTLEREILEFLSEFAKHSRYYNLDALNVLPASYSDPLERWAQILNAVLESDAPKRKVQDRLAQASALHRIMHGSVHAIQHGMDGSLLSLEEVFSLPGMHSIATPYAMVRLFRVLTPLLETINSLGHSAFYGSPRNGPVQVPLFSEFFVYFGGSDADIRRKKRWP